MGESLEQAFALCALADAGCANQNNPRRLPEMHCFEDSNREIEMTRAKGIGECAWRKKDNRTGSNLGFCSVLEFGDNVSSRVGFATPISWGFSDLRGGDLAAGAGTGKRNME